LYVPAKDVPGAKKKKAINKEKTKLFLCERVV
jgi:hypothetical protein